jgi:regulator of nucleoside diphosphate kinase
MPEKEPLRELMFLDHDVARMQGLLKDKALENHQYCSALREEITRGRIVSRSELPITVVTMYSTADVLDIEDNTKHTYTLVYPWEADVDNGKISVLAPVGTALIGYRKGDEVGWKVPSGMARFKILLVKQPAW